MNLFEIVEGSASLSHCSSTSRKKLRRKYTIVRSHINLRHSIYYFSYDNCKRIEEQVMQKMDQNALLEDIFDARHFVKKDLND